MALDDAAPDSAPAAPPAEAPDSSEGKPGVEGTHQGLGDIDPWSGSGDDHPDRPAWARGLVGVLEVFDVAILALVMLVCVRFAAHNYVVDGPSMEPTFEDGQFIVVNRLAYRSFDLSWLPGVDDDEWRPFGEPQQGDVIVFTQYSRGIPRQLIKRVIAVPGQTVEVRGGEVLVDGVPLDESYIAEPPQYEYPLTEVEPGSLFVLGDNRNRSADSHLFGAIPLDQVVGRADVRYWPLGEIGILDHGLDEGSASAAGAIEGGAEPASRR